MRVADQVKPITIDPRRQFGRPCVHGTRIPVSVLAEGVWAGDSVATTADAYGVTRLDVLMACWWWVGEGFLRPHRGRRKLCWVLWTEHAAMVLGGHRSGKLCDPDDFDTRKLDGGQASG